ncbi:MULTISPECIES: VanZ family protein [unclassified Streptomyces]|uniref:VanZ family protein n=1 Tax=unclassified Streptomyces TaxID=2593676 RepID=UPI002E23B98E|nr:VanZ family protein [Streptomyces sp. NBC_01023]
MSSSTHSAVMAALALVLAVAAVVAHRPVVRRTGWPAGAVLGALLAVAVCLGITLPDQIVAGTAGRLGACVAGDSVRTLTAGFAHNAVNVVLWVPLGLLGTLASRRPVIVTLAGAAAWVVVELLQTLDPVRSCQLLDWANNTLGVAAGALLGWLTGRARDSRRTGRIRAD